MKGEKRPSGRGGGLHLDASPVPNGCKSRRGHGRAIEQHRRQRVTASWARTPGAALPCLWARIRLCRIPVVVISREASTRWPSAGRFDNRLDMRSYGGRLVEAKRERRPAGPPTAAAAMARAHRLRLVVAVPHYTLSSSPGKRRSQERARTENGPGSLSLPSRNQPTHAACWPAVRCRKQGVPCPGHGLMLGSSQLYSHLVAKAPRLEPGLSSDTSAPS